MDIKRILTEATAYFQTYFAKHKDAGTADAESHLAKMEAAIKELDRTSTRPKLGRFVPPGAT